MSPAIPHMVRFVIAVNQRRLASGVQSTDFSRVLKPSTKYTKRIVLVRAVSCDFVDRSCSNGKTRNEISRWYSVIRPRL